MREYHWWTEKQIALLRELYPTIPAADLVYKLGHPEYQIRHKAYKLGIKANPSIHRLQTPYNPDGLSKEELAYIAGIIDGEGSIDIDKENRKARIRVSNTYYPLIAWLKCKVGGYIMEVRPRSSNHKMMWDWYLSSRYVIGDFLKRIMPFLIVKREKAEECLVKVEEHQRQYNCGKGKRTKEQ